MSVEDLATVVDYVLASRPVPALRGAAEFVEQARVVLAEVAHGSAAPELLDSVAGMDQAAEQLASVQQTCDRVEILLRTYLANLGVTPARSGLPAGRQPTAESLSKWSPPTSDAELIAEVRRNGHKISPERVVRIARARDGRVVWLEKGDEARGLGHLMSRKRVREFEGSGVVEDRIVDLVFDGLVQGEVVGYYGTDRPVHEVQFDGRRRRVAITTGSNGYIVGANPISMRTKLRERRERD